MAKTLKQASKAAIYRSKVKELDNLGTNPQEFLEAGTMSIIEEILGDFILRVQDNINKQKDMVVTGKISDIDLQAQDGVINVLANKHLLYQDRGVSGVNKKRDTPHSYTDKRPPVSVFREWIKRKNINLRNSRAMGFEERSPFDDMTEDKQINAAAWAMATKVFKEGFKGRKIYSKEIPKLIKDLEKEIADFAVQYLVQQVDVKPSAKRVIIKK